MRIFIYIFFLLIPITVLGRNTVPVKANIETKYQIWCLDSLSHDNDSVYLYWSIQSKGRSWVQVNKRCYIEDCLTKHKQYIQKVKGVALEPDTTILNDCEKRNVKESFSIPSSKTECINFRFNDNFYVTNINFRNGTYSSCPQPFKENIDLGSSVELSDRLFDLAIKYYKSKKYAYAIRIFSKVSEIDSILYSKPLFDNIFPGIRVRSALFNKKRPYEMDYTKIWIASCYHHLNNDTLAKKYFEFYDIPPFHRKYVKKADSLRICFPTTEISPSNREEAINAYNIALKMDSLTFGRMSYRYIKGLFNLASVYSQLTDSEHAIQYLEESKTIYEELIKRHSFLYSSILSEMGKVYYLKNEYVQSIKCFEKCFSLLGPQLILFNNYYYLLVDYLKIGDEAKANEIFKMSSEKVRNHNERKLLLNQYAEALYDTGYYKESIRQWRKSLDSNSDYSLFLFLGQAYLRLYDFYNANLAFSTAAEKYREASKRFPSIYNYEKMIYPYLATLEFYKKNYKMAIDYQKKLLAPQLKKSKQSNYSYFFRNYNKVYPNISNLALYYLRDNQCDSAIICEKYNLGLINAYNVKNKNLKIVSFLNIGEAYAGKLNYKKALDYTLKSYNMLGNGYPYDRRCLANLVKYSYLCNKKAASEKYLLELNQLNFKRTTDFFSNLTTNERSLYWDSVSRFYTDFLPKYTYLLHSDSLCCTLYNSFLFSKNILLNSEIKFRKSILDSDNSDIGETYLTLQGYKRTLLEEYKKNENMNRVKCDSLLMRIDILEDSLLVNSNIYKERQKINRQSWKDIQSKLSKDQVAIEFFDFEMKSDSKVYAALVIDSQCRNPELVKLFDYTKVKDLKFEIYEDNQKLNELVWRPLMQKIAEKDVIYFSPTGILHSFNIELCNLLKDKEVYRLSSTREILNKRHNYQKRKTAYIFGSLDYHSFNHNALTNQETASDFQSLHSRSESRNLFRNIFRDYSFCNLAYTKQEINTVQESLHKLNYTCKIYQQENGTEECFKSLSGKEIGVMHIATHGGYIDTNHLDQYKSKVNMKFLLTTNENSSKINEDIKLTHSFLVMSGANAILKNNMLSVYDQDDGILTAQEISRLDFRQLDLVVLSACKSGVGDISSDGVIGLQRGFKKAGARCILMSLNSIDDYKTYEFMTYFYYSLSRKNSYKKSYTEAITRMRKKYPRHPKYWNSFILLDALD